jgi:predicted NBD/HSP70 family sugar kinase
MRRAGAGATIQNGDLHQIRGSRAGGIPLSGINQIKLTTLLKNFNRCGNRSCLETYIDEIKLVPELHLYCSGQA